MLAPPGVPWHPLRYGVVTAALADPLTDPATPRWLAGELFAPGLALESVAAVLGTLALPGVGSVLVPTRRPERVGPVLRALQRASVPAFLKVLERPLRVTLRGALPTVPGLRYAVAVAVEHLGPRGVTALPPGGPLPWPPTAAVLTLCANDAPALAAGLPLLRRSGFSRWGLLADAMTTPLVIAPARRPVPWAWVAVGGSAAPDARPLHPGWVRSVRDACARTRVPFTFLGWGTWAPKRQLPEADLAAFWADASRSRVRGDPSWGVVDPKGVFWAETTPFNGHDDDGDGLDEVTMVRLGAAATGATLDGVTHAALPT